MNYYLDMLAYNFLNWFDKDTNVFTFMILFSVMISVMSFVIIILVKDSKMLSANKIFIFIMICFLNYINSTFILACREVALRFVEEQQTVTKYENDYTSEDGKISVSCTNLVNFNSDKCTVEVVKIRTITPWGFEPETETGWIRTYNTERFDYE